MGQWSEQGSPGQGGRSRGRTEPSDSSPRSDSSLEVIKMSWIKRNKEVTTKLLTHVMSRVSQSGHFMCHMHQIKTFMTNLLVKILFTLG